MPFQPMHSAPKDKRIIIKTQYGVIHAASWAYNPYTDEEVYLVCRFEDGTAILIKDPIGWMLLPPECYEDFAAFDDIPF